MVKQTTGNVSRVRSNGGGMEANTLAILDANDAKDSHDANEDRLQYLEAVRAASLVPETGIPPTNKMYQAIFRILRFGRTLELLMASFQILTELHERFPWVYMSDSVADGKCRLEIVDEAWSPFNFGSDVDCGEKETSVTSPGFQKLIQDLTEAANGIDSRESDTKVLGNMLLFQFLVNVLEEDFTPRNRVYKETMNWSILKESSLNLLLASRRINFKLLMKDCLSTMCALCTADAMTSRNEDPECSVKNDTCAKICLVEILKGTLSAMKKLVVTIMELDISKRKADLEGITTRGDIVRTPTLELIVDELTYDKYLLSTFLQVFNDPKWKLEIVLQYLAKYMRKPSVRTRRSNSPPAEDSTTLGGVLKSLSNGITARSITKKMGADFVQILIGHAFLAWLASNSSQQAKEDISEPKDDNSVTDMCSSIISAFKNLKQIDKKIDFSPFGKEALFTAVTILKAKS